MATQVQVAVAARFVMEVVPPPVVTVMRLRKAPRSSLDTIAEDERELQLSSSPRSDYGFAASAAWSSLKRMPPPTPTPAQPQPRERAGGFVTMRDLGGKYDFSARAAGGGWEGGHHKLLLGHWRAVHALELYKVRA